VAGFHAAAAQVRLPDEAAAAAAAARQDRLTKPRGSLGRMEDLGARLAAIAGACPPPVPEPVAVAVFAGDHGVLVEGVSPWPAEVTAQMVANFCAGGAAINVLARHLGASVTVVDVGVATDLTELSAGLAGSAPSAGGRGGPRLLLAKVRPGTANLAQGPAMSREEAASALDVGARVAAELVAGGARCLVTGDMGIGNTTPSAALIAALTGAPARLVTGLGTGISEEVLEAKVEVVERALARSGAGPGDPLGALAEVGGLEIGALAGYVVGAAGARVPVVIDGVIACAAALVAAALVPACAGYCVAGHRSAEPGAAVALDHLGLVPLLDLDLRLGEGTGACLAVPIVQAAARILGEMATFDSAGVTRQD
jgi:nicotinate-nucleotide--dimethylbenzimidazole phosphoribosyltransferase